MLCTVLSEHDAPAPYKPTHRHHPCTLWVGASLSNWKWLQRLALALNHEYRYRFDAKRDHRSAVVARKLSPPPIPDRGLTEFAQAMPDAYRVAGDPVSAYRSFYIGEKAGFASWTKRPVPEWFEQAQPLGEA